MSLASFFMASGVIAWGYLAWRGYVLLRGLPRRLKWAVWGWRRPRRLRVTSEGLR